MSSSSGGIPENRVRILPYDDKPSAAPLFSDHGHHAVAWLAWCAVWILIALDSPAPMNNGHIRM